MHTALVHALRTRAGCGHTCGRQDGDRFEGKPCEGQDKLSYELSGSTAEGTEGLFLIPETNSRSTNLRIMKVISSLPSIAIII